MFSCEFCKISKSSFFNEHLWVTASDSHVTNWNHDENNKDNDNEKITITSIRLKNSLFKVILARIFQHSDWIRRNTLFSPNAESKD